MIPDKIYIHELSAEQLSEHHEDFHIEYIRKESILEWARKEQQESQTILADDWWQKVIDKIEAL